MFSGANTTRRTRVFALLLMIQVFVTAGTVCDAAFSHPSADTHSSQALTLNIRSLEKSEVVSSDANERVPTITRGHRIGDLVAINRRINGAGSSVSNLNQNSQVIVYLSPAFKSAMISRRTCDEILPADDCEYLRTCTHETRGRP